VYSECSGQPSTPKNEENIKKKFGKWLTQMVVWPLVK
jgi:hypothetical protein